MHEFPSLLLLEKKLHRTSSEIFKKILILLHFFALDFEMKLK